MLSKNDVVTLEITGITNEGNGVGRHEDMAVFVPFTAVGDVIRCKIVKVKKSFCYGIISEILTPSAARILPDCSAFGKCGGCTFRHFSYEEELRVKQQMVEDSFVRIGGIKPGFEPILGCGSTEGYRNKAQYPVAETDGMAVCGFYSRRSHRIVQCGECKLQPKLFSEITAEIIKYVNGNGISAYNEESRRGLLRHICLRRGEHSGEIAVCLVVTSIKEGRIFYPLAKMLREKFPYIKSIVLNENSADTNVIMGDKLKVISGSETITDIMCGRRIRISPLSFYQVNTVQAERLYAIAADFADLSGEELLLDLYCGVGTIGLSMADRVKKLIGVEIVPQAIENAKRNAAENGVDNAEFICGDAGKIAGILYDRGERPDVIIADPARKGCTPDTLEYMAKMSPDRIVMISCNHATAARDCAALERLGYKAVRCRAVDLFPRSAHVECVVLCQKFM